MPKVAIKGGMANQVTMTPEKAPSRPHSRMAPRLQSTMSSGPAASAEAASRINQVHTTAEKAIRLPTERSMPAVMMTMVIPTARMAMTAIWLATFSRLSRLRKLGQR